MAVRRSETDVLCVQQSKGQEKRDMTDRTVTISFEDARRIFDLAVGMDEACSGYGSGYMETDDVHAMRRLAVAIDVDPAVCTSLEFVTQFPHAFEPGRPNLDDYRQRIVSMRNSVNFGPIRVSTPETDEQVLARLAATGVALTIPCGAGYWAKCGKPANDPIHAA